MHTRKQLALCAVALLFCCAASVPALAQKPKAKPAAKSKTARAKARPVIEEPAPPLNLSAEAALVAEQIKTITRFTFIFGKVSNSLEVAADEEKKGRASAAVIEQTRKGRDAVVANLADLAAGLEKIAARFQANPRLQVQYLKVSYAVEALSNARQLASSGQLNDAGKALVLTVERLADAMLALR